MTHQIHPEPHDSHQGSTVQPDEMSMMAVQEKLGLFSEHQTHTVRITPDEDQPTSDLQHILQEKPLSFV